MKMMKLKLIVATVLVGFGLLSCSGDDNTNNLEISCVAAVANTASAAEAYSTATDAQKIVKCVAYKAALQVQIASCGDASGALQLIINSLGDCTATTIPGVTGSITVSAGSSPRTFNTNIEVTTTGTIRHIYAEDSAGYYIEFDLALGATGASALQNFNIHLITSDYNPLAVSEGGNWTSNIMLNSATKITGAFNGYVTSSNNATLDLTSGSINLNL